MTRKVGDALGRYTLEGLLGSGGMGEVYRALDEKLGRRVAIKVLRAGAGDAAGSDWSARMLREARAAAALNHASAVSVFDVGEIDGAPFIVMELVQGKPLRTYIGDTAVPQGRRMRWLTDIARALAAAHAAGIVHRDVKPENVMVRDDGAVKVLDFGIARPTAAVDPTAPTEDGRLATLTQTGAILGTPRYMAPEQLKGAPLDGRTDQFAWGVMVYELLTGSRPWPDAADALQIAVAIVTEAPRPPREVNADLPEEVERTILRALEKSPDHRFASMEEAAAALEPFSDAASASLARKAVSVPPLGAGSRGDADTVATHPGGALAPAGGTARNRAGTKITVIVAAVALGLGGLAIARWSAAPTATAPTAAASTAIAPENGPMTILVLPFTNVTRRSEDDWLGVGMAEAIQMKLAMVDGLRVVTRREGDGGASNPGAGSGAAPEGASRVIVGSFQKIGEELKISARVEDPRNPGTSLAASEQRGASSGIFEMQDALAVALAEALRGGMDPAARAAMRRQGTRSLVAFEAYARGVDFIVAGRLLEAMREFDRAIAADPEYRPAQATYNMTRAEAHHVVVKADGAVIDTVYEQLEDTDATTWTWNTNVGTVRRAWDLEGNPLAVTQEKAVGEHFTIRVNLLGKGKPKKHSGFIYETESVRRTRMFEGLFLQQRALTKSKAGQLTYALELPPKVTILSALPVPIESSEKESGTFLLLRQSRDAFVNYSWDILFTADAATADRWRGMSVADRARWLLRGQMTHATRAEAVAQGSEPTLACLLGRQGKAAEARALVRTIAASPGAYGDFLPARARACVAQAEGDLAAALRELEAAVTAKERRLVLVQDTYLDIVDICLQRSDALEMQRLVRLELKRAAWWEDRAFHRALPEDQAEASLRTILAREPENPAARHDLGVRLIQAGHFDEAEALLAKDDARVAIYLDVLRARVAVERREPRMEDAARYLRRVIDRYPLIWAWTAHAVMLAEAGRAEEALAFLSDHASSTEYESTVYETLVRVIPRLTRPLDHKEAILAVVNKAPEMEYGTAYRIESLIEVILGSFAARTPGTRDLANALFADLRRLVGETKPEVCDKKCLRRLTASLCRSARVSGPDRGWLRQVSGDACEAHEDAGAP